MNTKILSILRDKGEKNEWAKGNKTRYIECIKPNVE